MGICLSNFNIWVCYQNKEGVWEIESLVVTLKGHLMTCFLELLLVFFYTISNYTKMLSNFHVISVKRFDIVISVLTVPDLTFSSHVTDILGRCTRPESSFELFAVHQNHRMPELNKILYWRKYDKLISTERDESTLFKWNILKIVWKPTKSVQY